MASLINSNKLRIAKKEYIILAMLLCFFSENYSQVNNKIWQWTHQLGGTGHDVTAGIIIDNENTLYIAGSFTGNILHGKEKNNSSGKNDLFVAAYRSEGKQKWIWTAGGEQSDAITALCLLPDNTMAIAGKISSSTFIGNKKSDTEDQQLFVCKLDEKGKPDWLRTFVYTKTAALLFLECDKEGNLFASGSFSDTLVIDGKQLVSNGKRDVFLISLTGNGGITEIKRLGGRYDEMPSAMTVDTLGNVIVGGSFISDFQADTLLLRTKKKEINRNIFLLTYSPQLEVMKVQTYHSADYLDIRSVQIDRQNRLYMTGNFVREMAMESKVLHSKGQADIYLAQFSSAKEINWLKGFGSERMDYAGDLVVDRLNGAVLTGAINDTVRSDSVIIEFDGAYSNAFVAQFSDKGKTLWAEQIPGMGTNMAYHTAVDQEGNLFLTGTFRNTIESGSSDIASFGSTDVFLAKFHNCEREEKVIEGKDILCPGDELVLSTRVKYHEIIWNDTIEDIKSIVVSQPGRYRVTLIDEKGCTVRDTLEVMLADLPVPSLGNDTVVDINENISLNPAGSYMQYLWQDNSVDSFFIAKVPGKIPCIESFYVSVLDSNACSGADTIEIAFVDRFPWLNLDESTNIVVFPNPVKHELNWYLETDRSGKIEVDITSASGENLYFKRINNYQPGMIEQISMQDYKPGVYFLGITGNRVRINTTITHK